ncbi:MAG: helix-hairpin-helix domain-containing protein [Spiroplasma sp.]
MDEYYIGVVLQYRLGKIIFEYNNHGFVFQGVNLHLLPLNQTVKLYIYFYQRLPISEYFAFLNLETKQYFLELISINYIGPKMALKILNFFSFEELKQNIARHDIVALQKVKGVTNKLALSIIDHFKDKNNLII